MTSRNKRSIEEKLKSLEFSDNFLSKQERLICHYCGKELFTDAPTRRLKRPKERFFARVKGIPKKYLASIDHVMPISKGGEEFDELNIVVACLSCNGKKGDKIITKETDNESV